jgi:hypothetical protein
VESRFRGPRGDRETRGDVVDRQVLREAEGDDHAQVDVQPGDCEPELLSVVRGGERVTGGGRLDDARDVDDGRPTAKAQAVAIRVDHDPGEPRVEPGRIPQRSPVLPGPYERVVNGVLRLDRVVEDRPRQPVTGVQVLLREPAERRGTVRVRSLLGRFARDEPLGFPSFDHDYWTPYRVETFPSPGAARRVTSPTDRLDSVGLGQLRRRGSDGRHDPDVARAAAEVA